MYFLTVVQTCNISAVSSPFYTGLDHVTGHQLESALQVFTELLLGPVEVSDEGLQGVQLPEQVF